MSKFKVQLLSDSKFKTNNLSYYLIVLLLIFGLQLYAQSPVLVENNKLTVTNLGGDNYTVGTNGELRISDPIPANGTVNLTSDSGWLILDGVIPSVAIASHFSYLSVNGQPAVNNVNIRVTNYLRGCVIMPHAPNFQALSAYKDTGYAGDEMKFIPYKYYKIADLGSFDNTISSVKLKKGYMVTFAQNENGTGYSKVFIADNADVEVSTLQVGLNDKISFIRVFPWRYTDKKGFASGLPDFNRTITPVKLTKSGWFYHWGTISSEDLTDVEFVSMRWNAKSLTDSRWKEILDINYSNHLLGFNEPDGATQANMTQAEMLLYWPKMLESGMRLGSPAPAGNLQVMYDFIDKCDELNYRVDFAAIHDYGEGTALAFYNKCKAVHDRTGRPIWVTEFSSGGTWTRSTPTYPEISTRITEIMEKYDTAGIIERYAIFNFDEIVNQYGGVQNRAVFATPAIPNYTFTPLGVAYRDNVSPMAFNPAEQINIPLKLVAPQNLSITYVNGNTNKLEWDNFNFTDVGTIFIERATGTGGYVTIAQINSNNSSYNDDISATGLVRYNYRLSVRQSGFTNSKFVLASIDLNPIIIFNVALNKSVFATSVHSAPYPAAFAVDGNSTSDASRWVTKAGELPAYIEIDLNGTFLISQLKFYSGYQGYNSPITNFVFQYLDSNNVWVDLVTETSNTNSSYDKSFQEVQTSKVRLTVNSTTSGIARFYEIEVYGSTATLGTNEFSASKFNIYPNPTSNKLNITGDIEVVFLEIFDINGKSVQIQKDSNSIDVCKLSTGTYFIKVNKKETLQFIKK